MGYLIHCKNLSQLGNSLPLNDQLLFDMIINPSLLANVNVTSGGARIFLK